MFVARRAARRDFGGGLPGRALSAPTDLRSAPDRPAAGRFVPSGQRRRRGGGADAEPRRERCLPRERSPWQKHCDGDGSPSCGELACGTWRAIAWSVSGCFISPARLACSSSSTSFSPGSPLLATWRGDFAAAASRIAEVDAITEATGTAPPATAPSHLAGCAGQGSRGLCADRGRDEERRGCRAGQRGDILPVGIRRSLQRSWPLRARPWWRPSAPASTGRSLDLCAWARTELIEAASRTGETRLAGETLERLAEATSVGDSDWGLGILARSRALLSEGEAAEGFVSRGDRAVEPHPAPSRARPGAPALRRVAAPREPPGRRARATPHRARHVHVDRDGGVRRARTDGAAGDRRACARHTVETRDDLTAQERQIAELARDGLSNPEIGARLFLSPRTVEWHLRHVFTKLGIRSRRELRGAPRARERERRGRGS